MCIAGVIQGSCQLSVVTMRTLVWTTLSILFLSGVGGSPLPHRSSSRTSPTQRQQHSCRCVPDEWEGMMTTNEHEFDLHDGHHVETGSHVRVYYDYSSRKFATRDLVTGRRSVSDYAAVRLSSPSPFSLPPNVASPTCSVLAVLARDVVVSFGRSHDVNNNNNYYYYYYYNTCQCLWCCHMRVISRVHPVRLINVITAPSGCKPSDQAN